MFESNAVSIFAKQYGASSSASSWAHAEERSGSTHTAVAPASAQSLALANSLQLRSGASRVVVFAATETGDSVVSLVAGLGKALAELGAGEVLMLDSSESPVGSSPSALSGVDQLISEGFQPESLFEEVLPRLYVLGSHVRATGNFRLTGENTGAFFNALRQRFRYVLVAAPPYAKDCEARLLARHSDGIVLAIRQGQQGRSRLLQIQRELKADRLVSLGYVLAGGSAK